MVNEERSEILHIKRPNDRTEFNQLVYRIVRAIPAGRVMSYGQIASCISAPRSIDPLAYRRIRARWVGYALADCPADVPWHRVVNRHGRASRRHSGSDQVQPALLESEGTPMLSADRVDLTQARWEPKVKWIEAEGKLVEPATDPPEKMVQ